MSERMNADKARALVETCARKVHLDYFDLLIEKAAIDGKTCVLIRGTPYEQAVRQGEAAPLDLRAAIMDLKARGFKVEQYFNEGQFVDCAMSIDWK